MSFVFTFIMIILGAIIGAGFASGKEIIAFFGQYGFWAVPFLVLACGIFFFFFYIFAKLGKMIKPNSISDMTNAMFGKAGVFVDFGFILCTFITLASMLAGSDSIGTLVFKESYNFCYISNATAIIVAIIVAIGLKYIYKITNIILPIMIVFIITILSAFLFSGNLESVSSVHINFNFVSVLISTFLYASMNTFTNIFIISKSSEYMNKKQVGLASLISSSIIFVLIALILFAILRGGDSIFLSDMPMVSIAFSVNSFFGVTYSIILWLAIFTTICIASYTIVEWLNRFIKSKFLCSAIVLTLGFIFSRFGFSTIVSVFYPIEGIFGGVIILYSIIFYYKNKRKYEAKERAIVSNMQIAESNAFFEFDSENMKSTNTQNETIQKDTFKKTNIAKEKKQFRK